MPTAINYNQLQSGLITTKVRIRKPAELYTFAQDVLFGNPSKFTNQDYLDVSTELDNIGISHEAVKGLDPNRVNYGVEFNTKLIGSKYFNDEDSVDINNLENRLGDEPIEAPWPYARRALELTAIKRDALDQAQMLGRELTCWECVLNGKFTTKQHGEFVYPMSNEMLNISGANLITDPMKTITEAAITLMKKKVRLKRIILNYNDGVLISGSEKWLKLLDNKKVDAGLVSPQPVMSNGLDKIGTIQIPIYGLIDIYIYTGTYVSKNANGTYESGDFLPQGKALLLPDRPIGCKGFTGIFIREGDRQGKVAIEKYSYVYPEYKGVLVTTKIQQQTTIAPILEGIDHYGVMTGITG